MELRTPDLVIRPPVPDDAAEAFELLNDPDVRRWNPVRECPDLATAEEWCRDGADWSDGSHATWHAVLRDTGRMVGNVSLFAIDADDRVAEIGYRVLLRARGRGVADRWSTRSRGGRSPSAASRACSSPTRSPISPRAVSLSRPASCPKAPRVRRTPGPTAPGMTVTSTAAWPQMPARSSAAARRPEQDSASVRGHGRRAGTMMGP